MPLTGEGGPFIAVTVVPGWMSSPEAYVLVAAGCHYAAILHGVLLARS
jgi:hypothetical protein